MELDTGFQTDMQDLMQYIGPYDDASWLCVDQEKLIDESLQNKPTQFPDAYEETGMFFDHDWMTEKIDLCDFDNPVFFQNDLSDKCGEVSGTRVEAPEELPGKEMVLDIGVRENTSIPQVTYEEYGGYEESPENNDFSLLNTGTRPIDRLSAADVDNVLMTDDVSSVEDMPSSPEQNVPSVESLNVMNIVEILCAGNSNIDKQKLYSSLSKITVNSSQVKYPKPTSVEARGVQGNSMMTGGEKSRAKQSYKMSRRTPEQKERKRLQNRNAATRYRSKKRSELDDLNGQCSKLEEDNKSLKKKILCLQHETDYLKKLIIDVYQKQ